MGTPIAIASLAIDSHINVCGRRLFDFCRGSGNAHVRSVDVPQRSLEVL